MPTTPIYALRYPAPADPADVPTDMGELATDVEAAVRKAGIIYGTSPPGSPADGDLWCLPVDTTNGVMWVFRYRSGSASAYKWEFVGGAEWWGQPSSGGGDTVSVSGNAWTYFGPTFTAPRAGDYVATAHSSAIRSSGNQGDNIWFGVNAALIAISHAGSGAGGPMIARWKATVAASATMRAGAQLDGTSPVVAFYCLALGVYPVRVS